MVSCFGAGSFISQLTGGELTDRLGWFTAGIGVILLLAGLASSGRLATRRTTERVDAH